MSRALRHGLPRMFRSHGGVRGVWFREHYKALEGRLGPFDGASRDYAGACAALWVAWRGDVLALEQAEQERRDGRGRRPSTRTIGSLKKRAALDWGSYDQALARLEQLTAGRPRASFADAVRGGRELIPPAVQVGGTGGPR